MLTLLNKDNCTKNVKKLTTININVKSHQIEAINKR